MNWTGGRRSRHSRHIARSIANVQRQHFAKARARLCSKSRLPSPFAEVPSGRGRNRSPLRYLQDGELREGQPVERRSLNGVHLTPELSHRTSQKQYHQASSLTTAEADTTTCDQRSARARFNPPPTAVRAGVELYPGNHLASRHRLLGTGNPRSPPLLANRKRKLLEREDWVCTTITRPLKVRYPPALDGQMIGRRHTPEGNDRHHRMPSTAEQTALLGVDRRYVGCRDHLNWATGERGPISRTREPPAYSEGEGLAADSGGDRMRGANFEELHESTLLGSKEAVAPKPLPNPPSIKANPALGTKRFATGSVAEPLMHNGSSRVAAPRIPRTGVQLTQSCKDEIALDARLSSSIASESGGIAGLKDDRSTKSDSSLSAGNHLDGSRFTVGTKSYHTCPQLLVCDSVYVEEEDISLKTIFKQQNKNSLTLVKSDSKKEAKPWTPYPPPTDTHVGISTTIPSLRVGISESSATRMEGNGGPCISTTLDELFWRSWLSSFIGNKPEAVEQTNRDPNAKKVVSDAKSDLNPIGFLQ